jgi:hypothetical protein
MAELICARCGEPFEPTRSDAEADAEYRREFPEVSAREPRAVICEVCWQEFQRWRASPEGQAFEQAEMQRRRPR